MRALRHIAIVMAMFVMIGELYRSWGDGRHIIWVLDDIFAGLFMLYAAAAFTDDTPVRRAVFAGAWGVAVGMLYMSFFSSFLSPDTTNSGNLDLKLLIAAKGVLFAGSIACLILSIKLPYHRSLPHE